MRKNIYLLIVIGLVIISQTAYSQTARIELDEDASEFLFIDLDGKYYIATETSIVLKFRYICDYDCNINLANAFKLTSEGATWTNFQGLPLCGGGFCDYFDTLFLEYGPESNDGPPIDEVGFGGLGIINPGWVTPYDDIPFAISFRTGDVNEAGYAIVLDITEFSGFEWVWYPMNCNPPLTEDIIPEWGGPYTLILLTTSMGVVLHNPPPNNEMYGNHCDGFNYFFNFESYDIPVEITGYSCNYGTINWSGNWQWTPNLEFEDTSIVVSITPNTNFGPYNTYQFTAHIAANTAPEFMMDDPYKLYSARPGQACEVLLPVFDACPTDPREYFVADDGGCAGSYYFTDSVMTYIPAVSDCALSPLTMTLGITDTRDSSTWDFTFYIAALGCCEGDRGDANCSGGDPDIADITRIIDYLYLTHAPLCCPEEADVNGSGGNPDISDITRLIDFLYLAHSPLAPCEITPYAGTASNSSCLELEKDGNDIILDCVDYSYDENMSLSIIHHNTTFNCCIENTYINISLSGDTLYITETENAPTPCDCMCLYDINYTIYNLPPRAYTVCVDEQYYLDNIYFEVDLQNQPTGSHCVERPW